MIFSLFMLFVLLAAKDAAAVENAPYVNAAVADTKFSSITAQCMDVIRSKKILISSRSWGLAMRTGLRTLRDANPIYNILPPGYTSADYDVRLSGGLSVIPTDAFNQQKVIHYLRGDKALAEINQLIRNAPHYFKDDIDVAFVFGDSSWDNYFATFDALRAAFPNIKFIYTTIGFYDSSVSHEADNTTFANFSADIRAAYMGKAPLYDYGYMVNDDGRCGNHYCPEYSTDSAGIHPNTQFINERAGKGFLVMLQKLFCSSGDSTPPAAPRSVRVN